MQLPTVLLTGIKAADDKTLDGVRYTIRGKLKHLPESCESFPPRWTIGADGHDYYLVFGDPKLEALATKLNDKVVVLSGVYDTEEGITVNALGDPVVKTQVEVIRVKELEGVDEDSIREMVNLDIVGELKHEVLQSWPPQDLWTITVNDKTYELKFSQDLPKEKPGSLEGKRVVATGRVLDNGKVLVTGIREATDR